MAKYTAAKSFHLGLEGKKPQAVQKGQKFECPDDYHAEHLAPHGLTEESSKKAAPKEEEKEKEKEKDSKKKG